MMTRSSRFACALVVVFGAACGPRVDVDKVPVGTEVQVTRQDGGVMSGTLAARDARDVVLDSGPDTRSVARADIADVQIVNASGTTRLPAMAKFREYTVPAGTHLSVRLDDTISSETNRVEDPVTATLASPLYIGPARVLPAGSVVSGDVVGVQPSGKVKGRASLAVRFRTLTARGHEYPIVANVSRVAPATKAEDAKKIGIPAAAGAVIGAIVGGGKGAAVGGAIGGGAGTAVVLSTPGRPVTLARGRVLTLSLARSVDVRVPIQSEDANDDER